MNVTMAKSIITQAIEEMKSEQGDRGRRYSSDAGERYQMDWGFVNVDTGDDNSYKVACFAMICHHCSKRYIEFFPKTMPTAEKTKGQSLLFQ